MNPIELNNPLATSRLGRGVPAGNVQRSPTSAADQSAGASQADRAAISNRGRFVASAIHAVLDAQDVRADRVAVLRAAIADGSYHTNARDVAARLLAGGTFEGDWK